MLQLLLKFVSGMVLLMGVLYAQQEMNWVGYIAIVFLFVSALFLWDISNEDILTSKMPKNKKTYKGAKHDVAS